MRYYIRVIHIFVSILPLVCVDVLVDRTMRDFIYVLENINKNIYRNQNIDGFKFKDMLIVDIYLEFSFIHGFF